MGEARRRFGLREAAAVGAVAVGVAGALNGEKPKTADRLETADDSSGVVEDGGGSTKKVEDVRSTRQRELRTQETATQSRDAVAVSFIKHLPEGYKVNTSEDTITITTDAGKVMGDVYVDPATHELTFQPPEWATTQLDALGDFQIDQYTFTNPEEITALAQDMNTVGGWVEEYTAFKKDASEDLFGQVGSHNYAEDVANSSERIEEGQKELAQTVQDESASLRLKIH